MLNYYHVLCISPTASRSDIEAALAKQHALGKLPPATLKLAADTLLTPESREVYDAKLASLPEMNQAYALSADDLALKTPTPPPLLLHAKLPTAMYQVTLTTASPYTTTSACPKPTAGLFPWPKSNTPS